MRYKTFRKSPTESRLIHNYSTRGILVMIGGDMFERENQEEVKSASTLHPPFSHTLLLRYISRLPWPSSRRGTKEFGKEDIESNTMSSISLLSDKTVVSIPRGAATRDRKNMEESLGALRSTY
ncbi:hypothetical protein RRG08_030472 [Elysia crispata]|uniref:Uncharacterized protein n=1 Tax=Elysia crispata TaxID=231223 RepID=A0AAE1B2B1_9GAST|nr:hypothetical protein RRG08_030472 [Elysia crispata]